MTSMTQWAAARQASAESSRFFICSPCRAENPPKPLAATTRWQGMMSGQRLFAITLPTARAARGKPADRANSP